MDFYDRRGRRVSLEAGNELLMDIDSRIVANSKIRDDSGKLIEVSTVHLVLNHGFGRGDPVIFETMVFGSKREELACYRYSTEFEASQGHSRVVHDVLLERGGYVVESKANPLGPEPLVIDEDWSP